MPKGSVAVDGVSMTIASVDENSFTIALIPATLENSTLGLLTPGDSVNIETDILARTVVHWLELQGRPGTNLTPATPAGSDQPAAPAASSGISVAKLLEHGFA